jgi:CDP-diacylglycerol---serine O-phosphatidyltransferase
VKQFSLISISAALPAPIERVDAVVKDANALPENKRFRPVPIRFLLPNLLTLLALCSGVTAIRLAVENRLELAVGAIIFAIVLDAMDGRLARYLEGTSRFGAELDSLADFVNFGVAPAIMLYFWSLNGLRTFGWVICLLLSIACALRLARFNVALEDPNKPIWVKAYFTGMPAPAGALLVMAPFYLGFLADQTDGHLYAKPIAAFVVLISILMVSRVPTFSGKTIARVPREYVLPLLAVMALGVVLLVAFPWESMAIAAAAYLGLIPVSIVSYRRRKRATLTD